MKKLVLFVMLIITILIFSVSINDSNADWRDSVNRFRERAKSTSERVRSGAQKARGSWEERKRECSDCGQTIHFGNRCARCKAKVTQKKWNDGRDKRRAVFNSIKNGSTKVINRIKDPETRRQVTSALNKGLDIRRKFLDAKRTGATKSINALADFRVGDTTFGEIIRNKLGNKFPGLDSAGLLDRDTAIATALGDKSFFFTEVDCIERNGQRMSVCEAIEDSSPFDANKTIKYLKVAGAAERIHSADDIGGALDGLIRAMDAAN